MFPECLEGGMTMTKLYNLLGSPPFTHHESVAPQRLNTGRVVRLTNKRLYKDPSRFTAVVTACKAKENKGLVTAVFCTDEIATDTSEKPMTADDVLNALRRYARKQEASGK